MPFITVWLQALEIWDIVLIDSEERLTFADAASTVDIGLFGDFWFMVMAIPVHDYCRNSFSQLLIGR